MARLKLAVIGNGMAGVRAVEDILERARGMFDITVIGGEPHVNYNRILLSSVLAGEKDFGDIVTHPRAWYEENGIELIVDDPATVLDAAGHVVATRSGRKVAYDKLLLATGSKPIAPPIPGLDLPSVCTFRSIQDVETMVEASTRQRRAVVIGGGLLGLEAAWGLKRRGMSVALVHLMPTLMERQLDETAGELLRRDLDQRGIAFFTNGQTEEIYGEGRVQGVRLADGRDIPADLVVVAIGIRPNIDLARTGGIEVNRGVVVQDDMRTSDPDIYAVGECVEHRGQTFGLVAPLWDMAKICAERLTGISESVYRPQSLATKLKITGIDVYSAGDFSVDEDAEEITFRDAVRGIYKKLVLRDNRLQGVVLYGDVGDGAWYFQLLKEKTDVAGLRDRLVFGRAYADVGAANAPPVDVAAMADDVQVCGCNGVCKSKIVSAIATKGLVSLEDVRAHTKASASCGQCTPVVEAILAHCTGKTAAPQRTPVLCKCTDLGHDDVRQAIVARSLKTIPQVRAALGWKTADGCHKCRPALNYYLLCAWPEDYVDDQQSRFINERVHANIQKDGTYSIVPRMWGGMTTSAELRAIADVVEKHEIPAVKLTGGQRIDLLGVRKEQLPAVWADLNRAGLVSGHAYGKALRTVKTCVGSEWCRFGVQDSTGLGIKLEQMTWAAWTPHKFKMAVSGCPRNCAEATIKDFGVVCVEGGYDLVVGGNGGITVRVTDPLARVASEEEVFEYCGAFLQLYREEAHYLERTAPWIERVGVAYVKRRLNDDAEGRRALHASFLTAQAALQRDPWAERAMDGVDAHEFLPLRKVG